MVEVESEMAVIAAGSAMRIVVVLLFISVLISVVVDENISVELEIIELAIV